MEYNFNWWNYRSKTSSRNIEVKPVVETWSPSIWTYIPDTKNVLIMGGSFGIEVALPAIIGYFAVIVYAIREKDDRKLKYHKRII